MLDLLVPSPPLVYLLSPPSLISVPNIFHSFISHTHPPPHPSHPPTHPLTGQYEELKKAKDSLEEEVHRLKAYKKECGHLKAEYNAIKLKVNRGEGRGER